MKHWKNIRPVLVAGVVLAVLSLGTRAETRGLVVPAPETGETIVEYKGSYALLIGSADYQNVAWPDLESIPGELARVETALQEQGFTVEKHLNLIGDELEDVYEEFLDRYGYDQDNRLVFFFSGHGWTTANNKRGFIVPVDAPDPKKQKVEHQPQKGDQMKLNAFFSSASQSERRAWLVKAEVDRGHGVFPSQPSPLSTTPSALPRGEVTGVVGLVLRGRSR